MPRRSSSPTDGSTALAVRQGLSSMQRHVRAESVDALAMLGDVPGLLAALGVADSYVRQRAAKELAQPGGVWVTWCLWRAVGDPAASVRAAVATALGHRHGWVAQAGLRRLAGDADAAVRYAALQGLAHVRDRRARRAIELAAQTDPEPWIRETASALLRSARNRRG